VPVACDKKDSKMARYAGKNNAITRRGFLKKASSAALGAFALPYVITSSALGTSSIPPAGERITLGHIGVGGRGSGLLKSFLQLPDAQSVAVCDPFKSRRDDCSAKIDRFYADKYGKSTYKSCAAYHDFRELLARKDIDAVVIATPDHWHVPIAIEAAKAGKDMYVEKPLGLSIAWDRALRETIKKYGNVFQYGTQQRSSRNFRFACELVRNGYIGQLKSMDVWCEASKVGGSTEPIPVPQGFDYDLWLGPAPWSPYTQDRCTSFGSYFVYDNCLGFIAGWGAHPLDIAQWGNNTDHTGPVEYQGTGKFPTEGLYDTAISWDIKCRYANDVNMHFMSTDIALPIITAYRKANRQGTSFIGTQGWVSVDRRGIYAEPSSLLTKELEPKDVHLYKSVHHQRNFLDCVKSRSETISGIEAAVRSDTVSHLSDIIIRTGRSIKWNPEKETVIADAEASRMLNRPMRSPWHL